MKIIVEERARILLCTDIAFHHDVLVNLTNIIIITHYKYIIIITIFIPFSLS